MKTRFAPSPTGFLHVGNARTALICFLHAKKSAGEFILRIDDTDAARSKEEYVLFLEESLRWLGIKWDAKVYQSNRFARYEEVLQKLIKLGRVYPCYETPKELEIKRKVALSKGKPPVYDRHSLKIGHDAVMAYKEKGHKICYRFHLSDEVISWCDFVRDDISIDLSNISDPILVRSDGSYTYMLPSVVDDIDYSITDVVRGADHITNTSVQIDLLNALGAEKMNFAHISLLHSSAGKISKRKNAGSLLSFRDDEKIEPMVLNSYLARIGTSLPVECNQCMQEIINDFDISIFSSATANFVHEDVLHLNCKFLHNTPFVDVVERVKPVTEVFWVMVRGNIKNVDEVHEWWRICKSEMTPIIENRDLLNIACDCLIDLAWSENTWKEWIALIKENSPLRGKELFLPLRLALTASKNGPELANILPMMSKDLVLQRLQG